jgi:hypothetical protein
VVANMKNVADKASRVLNIVVYLFLILNRILNKGNKRGSCFG